MKYKYKILKARSPELLASLMNRNDLKTGREHTYEIVQMGNQVYAIYKAIFDYKEEVDGEVDEQRAE